MGLAMGRHLVLLGIAQRFRFGLWVVTLSFSAGWHAAQADEIPLFKPVNAVSVHSPVQPVPPGGPFAYTASGPAADWGVVAWDIPGGDLSVFTTTTDAAGHAIAMSRAAEASVTVRHHAGGATITLLQDGTVLPCVGHDGGPRESDLFLSPNQKTNGFDAPGYTDGDHTYALTALKHLTAKVTVSYTASPVKKAAVCGVAQGGALIAVILDNRVTHQTLFYQLALTLICGPQPAPRLAFCAKMRELPRSNFFFTKNPFGVDDRLPLLGQPFLEPGETRTIEVDLLPRLLGFLRAGPLALDTDASHWTFGAFYAGQNIWGGVALTTHWSNIQLIADVAR